MTTAARTSSKLSSPSSAGPASCAARWATPRTGRPTYGSDVAAIAAALGTPLDPWQRQVVDTALEVDPDTGRLAYSEVWVLVPRQQGKTTLLLALAVWRAVAFPDPQRILYTAQTRSDARKKWEDDWLSVIARSPLDRVHHARKTNGHEASIWSNGSHIGLVASTEKAGHGQVLDLGILDEAFAQVDARVEQAFRPAMNTRPDAQFWGVSTAGTPDSVYLRGKVARGRELVERRAVSGLAYFEWAAGPDEDPGDPATWYGCMPTLGLRTPELVVRSAFETMELSEFRRAFLNQWTEQGRDPVIPADVWRACHAPKSGIVGPLVLAVDVTPDRARASIVAAGGNGAGREHVEVVDNRAGTGWCAGRLAELCARHDVLSVVLDPAGPAGSLIAEIEEALPDGARLRVIGAREMGQWCGLFYDRAVAARLAHLGDQRLEVAVAGAARRKLGGAWAWARSGSVDISPLVAATLAVGAHTTTRAPGAPILVFA